MMLAQSERRVSRDVLSYGVSATLAGLAAFGWQAPAQAEEGTAAEGDEAAPLQQAQASDETAAEEIPEVKVRAGSDSDRSASYYETYKRDMPSLDKLLQPLQDTPQIINVVPGKLLQEKNITTLRDALRFVPGVAFNAGEGGQQGDISTIRGFSARGDIFLDGLRDYEWRQETFNLDAVEVLKGPSSILFGRGSTGGVINMVSKTPQLDTFYNVTGSFGMGPYLRGTADFNQPIGDDAAARLNVVLHDEDVVDRDTVENNRFGFAPSIAFGLNDPLTVTLSFYHLNEYNVPDYGQPFVNNREYDWNRSNFYGTSSDYQKTDTNILTADVDYDVNGWLTLSNTFRAGWYDREQIATATQAITYTPGAAGNNGIFPQDRPFTPSNGVGRLQSMTQYVNNTLATAEFSTGFLDHAAILGFEFGWENYETASFSAPAASTGCGGTTYGSPDPSCWYRPTLSTARSAALPTKVDAFTWAVYAADQVFLTDQWSIVGGFRYDHESFDYENQSNGAKFSSTDGVFSPRAALVYEPTDDYTFYFSYGESFNPSAEYFSLSAATEDLAPETARTFELGAKLQFLNGALAVDSALFRIEKTNARITDPDACGTGNTCLAGNVRVQGFEIGITGNITDDWSIYSGYSFLHSEIVEGNANEEGKELLNTPKNSAVVWSTYQVLPEVTLGAGAFYMGKRYANNTNTRDVESYVRMDAMLMYNIGEHITLTVNGYNLNNADYADAVYQGFYVPGAGRTVVVTAGYAF